MMILKSAGYNIVFPRIDNLRRKAFEIEDHLNEYFTAANIIPVPDIAPAEIPRISSTSHNGHSNLNISLTNAQIVTRFDNDFSINSELSLKYVEDRVYKLTDLLKEYTRFYFSGLTTEIHFLSTDPISTIIKNFTTQNADNNFYDVNCKFTSLIADKYYVNISVGNERLYEGFANHEEEIVRLANMNLVEHLIKVTIDINDRHAFNSNKEYWSSVGEIQTIFEIIKDILNHKMERIISEGVIDL